jgi:hypothetical protein
LHKHLFAIAMWNYPSKSSLESDEESPADTLIEFARLIEHDGITSDSLRAFVQSMLSVHLIEPNALCRKAALRLSSYDPPLDPHAVAMRIYQLACEIQNLEYELESCPRKTPPPGNRIGFCIKRVFRRICRFWRPQ